MAPDLSDDHLRQLIDAGLSQREITRRTGIPRSTLQKRLKRLGLHGGPSPVDRPPTPVDCPPDDRPPSTLHPLPSTVEQLQVALTAALQPVLARLDTLEMGLARPPADVRPPSIVDPHPSTVDPSTVDRPSSAVDHPTWELRELKHSVRWTIYVPLVMKEEIQRLARDRHQPPSVVLQELLWQALRSR